MIKSIFTILKEQLQLADKSPQSGSALILSLLLVSMSMLLVQGILSVAEVNTAKTQAQLIAQSSANAGAVAWGDQWLISAKDCVKTKIAEQLAEPGPLEPEFEVCRPDLPKCVEDDFKGCSFELKSCWADPDKSPLKICPTDSKVLSESEEAGREAVRSLVSSYQGDYKVESLQVSNEKTKVSLLTKFKSIMPTYGKSQDIIKQAESLVVINVK